MPEHSATFTPVTSDRARAFAFLDPGPLIDGDLELVAPHSSWIDDALAACRHPLTRQREPEMACTIREDFQRLLRRAPQGHEPADPTVQRVPVYHFWMHITTVFAPVRIAGSISLRIGQQHDIEMYFGHIGYHVYPPARGRRYARRACRLLFGLARRHGFDCLWITCDPDNIASRRTCEGLGAEMVEMVNVPPDHILFARGQRQKCRYRINL